MNQVQIIADSKSPQGNRLITAILTFPRYLLAEFNTHRMLSRNSASSRAIRFEKMVESVQKNPFIPMRWMKDHPGMQGNEYITDKSDINRCEHRWLLARDRAITEALVLHDGCGVTKQICNRLLEPFMYHTALVSGTELENFFALRAEDGAEIHFQDLAYKFLEACNKSEPRQLNAGEWHIPFGDEIDEDLLYKTAYDFHGDHATFKYDESWKIKIATVRAARISYVTPGEEGKKTDYIADLKLHDRLANSGHFSTFEHCARAMSDEEYTVYHRGQGELDYSDDDQHTIFVNRNDLGWCKNFRGFIQYRHLFTNENRKDSRLIKK